MKLYKSEIIFHSFSTGWFLMLVVSELILLWDRRWISTTWGLSSPVDVYVYWPFQGGKHVISSCHCQSLSRFVSFRFTNSRCAVSSVDTLLLSLFSIPIFYCYDHMMVYIERHTMPWWRFHACMINYMEYGMSLFNHPPSIPHTVSKGQPNPYLCFSYQRYSCICNGCLASDCSK